MPTPTSSSNRKSSAANAPSATAEFASSTATANAFLGGSSYSWLAGSGNGRLSAPVRKSSTVAAKTAKQARRKPTNGQSDSSLLPSPALSDEAPDPTKEVQEEVQYETPPSAVPATAGLVIDLDSPAENGSLTAGSPTVEEAVASCSSSEADNRPRKRPRVDVPSTQAISRANVPSPIQTQVPVPVAQPARRSSWHSPVQTLGHAPVAQPLLRSNEPSPARTSGHVASPVHRLPGSNGISPVQMQYPPFPGHPVVRSNGPSPVQAQNTVPAQHVVRTNGPSPIQAHGQPLPNSPFPVPMTGPTHSSAAQRQSQYVQALYGPSPLSTANSSYPRPVQNSRQWSTYQPNALNQIIHQQGLLKVQQYRQSLRRPLGGEENNRVMLLEKAVVAPDQEFLIVHQFYCQVSLKILAGDGLGKGMVSSNVSAAIPALQEWLAPNERMPKEFLQFGANFPIPSALLLREWPHAFETQRTALTRLVNMTASHWNALRRKCVERGSPPTCLEIASHTGVNSCMLQETIWTFLIRWIWGSHTSPSFQEATSVFHQDYRSYMESHGRYQGQQFQPQPLTQAEERRLHQLDKNTGERYRQLQKMHEEYLRGQQPRAQRPLAQPQVMLNSGQRASSNSFINPPRANTGGNTPNGSRNTSISSQVSNHVGAPLRAHVPSSISPAAPHGAQVSSIFPPPPQAWQSVSFLPPPGRPPLPQHVHPRPEEFCLHQAALFSPDLPAREDSLISLEDLDLNMAETSKAPSKDPLFRWVTRFLLGPTRVKLDKGAGPTFSFDLSSDYLALLAIEATGSEDPQPRPLKDGSVELRLRMVVTPTEGVLPDEATWAIRPTHWPMNFYPSFNDKPLQFRRKPMWGSDQPVDLNTMVREGANTLKVTFNIPRAEVNNPLKLAIAIEEVKTTSLTALKSQIHTLPAGYVKRSIMTHLQNSAAPSDDDDVIAMSASLTINLTDQWDSSKVVVTPVRGVTCRHRDCFDLDTFLETRKRKNPKWPTVVDHWQCPICRADARPPSLRIDGFVAEILEGLKEMKLKDVKRVLVEPDGSWKPQEERDKSARASTGRASLGRATETPDKKTAKEDSAIGSASASVDARRASAPPPRQPEVIELDDD